MLSHGLVARLSGDVATTLRVEPAASAGSRGRRTPVRAASGARRGPAPACRRGGRSGRSAHGRWTPGAAGGTERGDPWPGPVGWTGWTGGPVDRLDPVDAAASLADMGARLPFPAGTEVVLDAVSAAWAEHFARALAPLREADAGAADVPPGTRCPPPCGCWTNSTSRVATPARIAARWDEAPGAVAGAAAVIGLAAGGRIAVDLVAEGPHAMVGGAPGAGKTELLRSLAAALAAGERPDRLALVLVDGAGPERGEGLASCADLPHVTTHLAASDPVRMREFAQALTAELKRRAEVLADEDFAAWHARRAAGAMVPHQGGRGAAAQAPAAAPVPVLPRLVVVVDDFDALVAPGLGSPGRPAAGSVVRALEAVARDGERLGVHLFAATGRPERTAGTDADERARLRIALRMPDPESAALLVHVEDPAGLDDALPGRGYLRRPGGAVTALPDGPGQRAHPAHGDAAARPSSRWSGSGWATRRPAARSANWATAPPTWPCWPARCSGPRRRRRTIRRRQARRPRPVRPRR